MRLKPLASGGVFFVVQNPLQNARKTLCINNDQNPGFACQNGATNGEGGHAKHT